MSDGSEEMAQMGRELARVPAEVRTQARAAMSKAGADIQATAQNLAPVDTGFLRNSGSRDQTETRDTFRIEIGFTASYAGFIESGTSRMRAQPFLRPAVDRVEPRLFEAFKQIGGRIL